MLRMFMVAGPTHVVLVGETVQRFAAQRSPVLLAAVKEHGPLPLCGLVRHVFRHTEARASDACLDDAFRALRTISSVEDWVRQNNELFDSLEGLSDREMPPTAETSSINLVASQLLARA